MTTTLITRRSSDVEAVPLPTMLSVASSLLVSNDAVAVEQITNAMQALAITTEVCGDIAAARQILHTRKFDVVAVDFELGGDSVSLLGELRISPSNRTAPSMAITRSKRDLALAYCAGTTFVLERPLSAELLDRTLSAGYGLVVRERRRYFRCPVRTRISLRRADMRRAHAYSVNISEGGMEIMSAPAKLVRGVKVQVEFALPDRTDRFSAACETVWRDHRGHAGLRFLLFPLERRCDLQEWLSTKLEEGLPESVAERFRNANDRYRSGLPLPFIRPRPSSNRRSS
jgi:hypothetical protein